MKGRSHLTVSFTSHRIMNNQEAVVVIKSFEASDDTIRALFREYIFRKNKTKLAIVKYRLALKV